MDEILLCRNCMSCQKESEVDSERRQSTLKKKFLNYFGEVKIQVRREEYLQTDSKLIFGELICVINMTGGSLPLHPILH